MLALFHVDRIQGWAVVFGLVVDIGMLQLLFRAFLRRGIGVAVKGVAGSDTIVSAIVTQQFNDVQLLRNALSEVSRHPLRDPLRALFSSQSFGSCCPYRQGQNFYTHS